MCKNLWIKKKKISSENSDWNKFNIYITIKMKYKKYIEI